jgi:hypothetical protein
VAALITFLGLHPGRAFYADAAFWLAVLAGVLFWGVLAALEPVAPLGWWQLLSWQFGLFTEYRFTRVETEFRNTFRTIPTTVETTREHHHVLVGVTFRL